MRAYYLTGMARASVNGVELSYEEHGNGPTLLLVPGLGADTRLFCGVIGPFAATYRVIVFDPRGAGRSDKPPGPYTIEQMADDAEGLLDVLRVERVVAVGCSMGGRTALGLALDHSTRVRRLVLAATSARGSPSRILSRRWLTLEVLSRLTTPGERQPRWASGSASAGRPPPTTPPPAWVRSSFRPASFMVGVTT